MKVPLSIINESPYASMFLEWSENLYLAYLFKNQTIVGIVFDALLTRPKNKVHRTGCVQIHLCMGIWLKECLHGLRIERTSAFRPKVFNRV